MITLSTKVPVFIKNGDETILDIEVSSRTLTKKEQKKLMKMADTATNPDAKMSENLTSLEAVAKARFDLQIEGKEKEALSKFCEEYGYSIVLQEIDTRVAEIKGK